MKEVTKAYKCDYCGRLFATKSGIAKHEKHCRKNPANIACCRCCRYLVRTEKVESGRKETFFHCTAKNENLYHPRVERMSEYVKSRIIDGQDAIKMPTIDNPCELFNGGIFDTDLF